MLLAAATLPAQGPTLPAGANYLELTPEQLSNVYRQNNEFRARLSGLRVRQNLAMAEVAKETAAHPLNPPAMGARWVEVLTLQRESLAAERELLAANRSLLTDTQKSKLATLQEAVALTPSVSLLQSLYFLPQTCTTANPANRWFDTPQFVPNPFYLAISNTCTTGAIGAIIPGPLPGVLWPALAPFLQLTEAQMAQIVENSRAHNDWYAIKSGRVSQVHLELMEESSREPLDAMALGFRYVELEVIRREIQAEHEKLLRANQELLTAEQRAKFAQLEEAARLTPALNEARGLQLIKRDCTQLATAMPFPSSDGCAASLPTSVIRVPFPGLP